MSSRFNWADEDDDETKSDEDVLDSVSHQEKPKSWAKLTARITPEQTYKQTSKQTYKQTSKPKMTSMGSTRRQPRKRLGSQSKPNQTHPSQISIIEQLAHRREEQRRNAEIEERQMKAKAEALKRKQEKLDKLPDTTQPTYKRFQVWWNYPNAKVGDNRRCHYILLDESDEKMRWLLGYNMQTLEKEISLRNGKKLKLKHCQIQLDLNGKKWVAPRKITLPLYYHQDCINHNGRPLCLPCFGCDENPDKHIHEMSHYGILSVIFQDNDKSLQYATEAVGEIIDYMLHVEPHIKLPKEDGELVLANQGNVDTACADNTADVEIKSESEQLQNLTLNDNESS